MNAEDFDIPNRPSRAPRSAGDDRLADVNYIPAQDSNTPLADSATPDLIDAVPDGPSDLQLTPDELRVIEERRKKQERGNPIANFLKKPVGKGVAALAALSLAGGLGAGIASAVGAKNTPPAPNDTIATGPATPGQTENTPTAKEQIKDVPAEAKDFVDKYGSQFSDPVSTYYAMQASKTTTYNPIVLTNQEVAGYVFNDNVEGSQSPMGFAPNYMLPQENPTLETTAAFFNKFTIPWCLTPYLNTVARNPSAAARKVVDNEFMKYCGAMDRFAAGSARESQRQSVQNLLDNLKSIADQYGTTAVFKIADATSQQNASELTTVSQEHIDSVDKDNITQMVSADVTLAVDVQTFHSSTPTDSQASVPLHEVTLTKGYSYDQNKPIAQRDAVPVSIAMR